MPKQNYATVAIIPIQKSYTAQNLVEENTTPSSKHQENRQRTYVTVAVTKLMQNSSQSWIKISYRTWKNRIYKSVLEVKVEQFGYSILFPQKNSNQFKSEADLMLALDETLQKAGVKAKVQFSRVQYISSRSILVLFIEKTATTMLISSRSNLLI